MKSFLLSLSLTLFFMGYSFKATSQSEPDNFGEMLFEMYEFSQDFMELFSENSEEMGRQLGDVAEQMQEQLSTTADDFCREREANQETYLTTKPVLTTHVFWNNTHNDLVLKYTNTQVFDSSGGEYSLTKALDPKECFIVKIKGHSESGKAYIYHKIDAWPIHITLHSSHFVKNNFHTLVHRGTSVEEKDNASVYIGSKYMEDPKCPKGTSKSNI